MKKEWYNWMTLTLHWRKTQNWVKCSLLKRLQRAYYFS